MFNEISRDKIFEIIEWKYPELLPSFSVLYGKEGSVFFKMADGLWHTQEMVEGENQGCPLSATLAALVFGEVLCPLDDALKARARKRWADSAVDISDDGGGSKTHPMGYIDDVGAATHHVDVIFFFEEFNRLGKPFGLYLNPSKTRVLISTRWKCPLSYIGQEYASAVARDLRKAISLYSTDSTLLSTIASDLSKMERT